MVVFRILRLLVTGFGLISLQSWAANNGSNIYDILVSVSCEDSANVAHYTRRNSKGEYPNLRAALIYSNTVHDSIPLNNNFDYRVVKLIPGKRSAHCYVPDIRRKIAPFAFVASVYSIKGVAYFPLRKINSSLGNASGNSVKDSLLSVVMYYGDGYKLASVTQQIDPAFLSGSKELHLHIYDFGKKEQSNHPFFNILLARKYNGNSIKDYSNEDKVQTSEVDSCFVRGYDYSS